MATLLQTLQEIRVFIEGKFNKAIPKSDIVQNVSGSSTDDVPSQNAVRVALSNKPDVSDILWEKGIGTNSAVQKGGNNTAYGTSSTVEGKADNTAASQGITISTTQADIITAWESNKFSLAHGDGTHVEGSNGLAFGTNSHVEGNGCIAGDNSAHAEGNATIAVGPSSHSEGIKTIAKNKGEHAEGFNNKSNKASDTFGNAGNTIHSIGIGGTGNSANAIEVMQNGDVYIKGLGGYDGTNPDVSGVKHLAAVFANIGSLNFISQNDFNTIFN